MAERFSRNWIVAHINHVRLLFGLLFSLTLFCFLESYLQSANMVTMSEDRVSILQQNNSCNQILAIEVDSSILAHSAVVPIVVADLKHELSDLEQSKIWDSLSTSTREHSPERSISGDPLERVRTICCVGAGYVGKSISFPAPLPKVHEEVYVPLDFPLVAI